MQVQGWSRDPCKIHPSWNSSYISEFVNTRSISNQQKYALYVAWACVCEANKMHHRQKYWYPDHWCVLSGSLEMLSAAIFPFISSLLLLECRLQVKCKPFPHNIQQSIWYEICPKWHQKQLIIWITACNGSSLAFFFLSAFLNNLWHQRMRESSAQKL